MGCDGGTIPKRNEVVKNKHKEEGRDKSADLSAKWLFCYLSGLRLKKPIVSCQLGHIYNKDAILEHLLDLKTSRLKNSAKGLVSHIRSLKDVKELKLKEKANFDKSHQASSSSEQFKAQFVCPISGLDMNGKYKFYYPLTCGCVISEKALKEVPNDRLCILCSKPYDPDMDLIILNGDQAEETALKERLSHRKRLFKKATLGKTNEHPLSITAGPSDKRHLNVGSQNEIKPLKKHKTELTPVR